MANVNSRSIAISTLVLATVGVIVYVHQAGWPASSTVRPRPAGSVLSEGFSTVLSVSAGSAGPTGSTVLPAPTRSKECWVEPEVVSQQLPSLSLASRSETLFAYVHGYAGQQGSGIRSLSVFQCFLTSLHGKNALIAEPMFKDSYFYTYTNSNLTFSSLLDLNYFNEQSRKIGYPEMINHDEFTRDSPRYAVYILIRGLSGTSLQRIIWQAPTINNSLMCLENDDIPKLSRPYGNPKAVCSRKCVVRIVELWAARIREWDGTCASSVNNIRRIIFGDLSPKEVTLIFTYFAFYKYPPLAVPPNTIDCTKSKQTRVQFRPGEKIIRDAQAYMDTFLGGVNRLAIMLRIERIVISSHDHLTAVKKCFNEVLALKKKLAMNSKPLVTMDVGGEYGTGTSKDKSLRGNVEDYSIKTFESLYNNAWSVSEWEKSFVKAAGGVTDRGYIAALQRVLASRADCLVLVGGGDFQAMAVLDFMQYHNSKECIHVVCDKTGILQEEMNDFRTISSLPSA